MSLEQTMFSFDVMVNDQLYSRQETVLPVVRLGKMSGLEIRVDDARLDPIHMVFHVMTGKVYLDIVTDKDVMVTRNNDLFLRNRCVLVVHENDRFRLTEDISIQGCKISFIEGQTGYSGLSKSIDKDVQTTLGQMGIVYGSITDLTPDQRIIHALVTKLATFAAGTSRTLGQLSNVTQQCLLRSNYAKNACDVLSDALRQHTHPVKMHGSSTSPMFHTPAAYQEYISEIVRGLAERAANQEPTQSPVDAVEATILDMQRARIKKEVD